MTVVVVMVVVVMVVVVMVVVVIVIRWLFTHTSGLSGRFYKSIPRLKT